MDAKKIPSPQVCVRRVQIGPAHIWSAPAHPLAAYASATSAIATTAATVMRPANIAVFVGANIARLKPQNDKLTRGGRW
jgi:hypothetical protein